MHIKWRVYILIYIIYLYIYLSIYANGVYISVMVALPFANGPGDACRTPAH